MDRTLITMFCSEAGTRGEIVVYTQSQEVVCYPISEVVFVPSEETSFAEVMP